MADTFQLVAGHVALDFANTLDNRYDPARKKDLLPTYAAFLAFARQSGVITKLQAAKLFAESTPLQTKRALSRVVEAREALQSIFSALVASCRPDGNAVRTVNALLAEARSQEQVLWTRGQFVHESLNLTARLEGPLWPIVTAAADLLTAPEIRYVRECGENSCRWLYCDRSKNHSRRWCDMRVCGNRSKARRFHSRQGIG